jgi:hypothetical protein
LSHTLDRCSEMCCFIGAARVVRRHWSKLGLSALLTNTDQCFYLVSSVFEPATFVNSSWTPQGFESVPQGCWPILTPLLPTVVSRWLNVLWVVDHSWYTWETVKRGKTQQRCSSWHNPMRLAPSTIPSSIDTSIFCLAQSPSDWHKYTIHISMVSRHKNPSLTCLHWLNWI